jgi:predicted hydrocarbon binding protein
VVQFFVDASIQEVGLEKFPAILAECGLDRTVIEKDSLTGMDPVRAAETYAALQQALRSFYGRGARGLLQRVGRGIWERMAAPTSFREKAEFEIARRLPVPARRRRALDLVAERLREGGGMLTVHTLDLDLLLVDHTGAACCGQRSAEPICYVTLGLIDGAFYWAAGHEVDVEEIACKATGAVACEFKVKLVNK